MPQVMGSYFADHGWNPCPLQWKLRVLTAGRPVPGFSLNLNKTQTAQCGSVSNSNITAYHSFLFFYTILFLLKSIKAFPHCPLSLHTALSACKNSLHPALFTSFPSHPYLRFKVCPGGPQPLPPVLPFIELISIMFSTL